MTARRERPAAGPAKRLRRAERRAQILDAATRAFARTGFAATSLDDVATEAAITIVLLYRHFDSKAAMYRAVLDRACERLDETVGSDDFDGDTLPGLVRAATADPDAFRLLFHHASREPDFRDIVDSLTATSTDVAERHLAALIPAGPWLTWAARVVPVVTIEAIIGWLDAGQPDPDLVAGLIRQAIGGVIGAAQQGGGRSPERPIMRLTFAEPQ